MMECIQPIPSHNTRYLQPKWLFLEMCILKSHGLCFVVAFSHLRQLYKYAIKKKKEANRGKVILRNHEACS